MGNIYLDPYIYIDIWIYIYLDIDYIKVTIAMGNAKCFRDSQEGDKPLFV